MALMCVEPPKFLQLIPVIDCLQVPQNWAEEDIMHSLVIMS
jgi:hypothetical protein